LKEENEKLQNMVSSLEKENKDLKGKNTYLRHLHSEQKAEIKSLNEKLAQVNTNPKREDRFLSFMSTWQLTGLTSNFVIFRNTKNSSVVRVGRGEMIGGVRIIDIDSYAGIINTSEGDIMFNAG
jgi:septal ring factor EnvC (AmiA/AmiB activator)